jgi:F0F1-type ATP synthase assembly protein I
MLPLTFNVLTAAVVGAGLGHLNRCPGGTCPMFANWKRGLIIGALIGLVTGLRFLQA